MQVAHPVSMSYIKPLLCAVIPQMLMLVVTGLMADSGVMLTWVIYSIWTFWAIVALIVIRHRSRPTQGNLHFLTWGFWIIAFVFLLTGQLIEGYIRRVILQH